MQTNTSANSSSSQAIFKYDCHDAELAMTVSTAFVIAKIIIVVPLSILVLYLGHQQWRLQCSFTTTSHSDIFTYHAAALELVCASGAVVYFCGRSAGHSVVMMMVGTYVSSVVIPGEMFFNILTCVERYLAVVHPVTYLGLKQSGGVRIRNISIGCVWLLCFGWLGVVALYQPDIPYVPYLCLLVFSSVVVSFCSLSVLCILIRPGPGEKGGERKRVDQSKQKAFHTITAIMVVLLVFFLWLLITLALKSSLLFGHADACMLLISAFWFSLPCSLVLPLLFLQRSGKVLCCHCSYK